jgi:diguanylate cyclase (GGDEF)-like protein
MALMISIILFVWSSAKNANMAIEKMAYEDSVTKGKNINYFKEFSNYVMSVYKETPFVIYRFDISNFRYINEAYGHKRADEVLSACINIFADIFSDKELCVRMNADQFLAIIVNDKYVQQKMEQARGYGIKYPIKFKTGIYQIRKHDHDIDIMIDHANVARKSLSGDEKDSTMVYSEKIVNDMRKIDKIESEMQHALASGEFKVYIQPKWDIGSNTICGGEALVRWIKPDGTMVYPDEFIPIFENNGFIEKLDFFMLERVCESMRQAMNERRAIYPISVNQSRVFLHSPDYVDNVTKIVKNYDIPAGYVELEITETVFDDEKNQMINTLNMLRKVGLRFAMDDFGSGYSSLNILKEIPFDIIKIDKEFFSESVTGDNTRWILQKIIEMVNGLGKELVCEGVETKEQSDMLSGMGCRVVQGYYYSKPIELQTYIDTYCKVYT